MAKRGVMNLSAFLAEDRGPSVLATASVTIVLSTVFVGLRYYARYLSSASFSIQDVIIPFAWLAEVGVCITSIIMVELGNTGRHMDFVVTVDPHMINEHFEGVWVLELLYPTAVTFPKLLVALLYLHILTNKYERMAAKILVVLISATWFSFTVAADFQCTPFAFNWDKTVAGGKCFNVQIFANSSSVPNIITDLGVLVLPLRTVWELKISVGKRVGLLLIFLTGSVGIITSIIRIIVFAKRLAETGPLVDITWNHVALIRWTIIEPGMYLFSACALSFKPLFCMLAKALHLQALITHTKPTLQPSLSYTNKKSERWAHTDYKMQDVNNGRFYRLSKNSNSSSGSKKMAILVTTAAEVEIVSGVGLDGKGY